jgi:trehalose-phosphatase
MRHKIAIRPGKKVLEITPPIRWNKGKAIQWVLAHERPEKKIVFPIAAGDDISDETAFAAVAAKGFSVLVGKPRQSAADYYVKNTEELREFLRLLNGIC